MHLSTFKSPIYLFITLLSFSICYAQTSKHIDVYGDSTIEGWSGDKFASQNVTMVMERNHPGFKVNNFGVSGEKLSDIIPRWEKMTNQSDASLILVNWGLNDAIDCNKKKFRENLTWLIRHTHPKLALITPNTLRLSAIVNRERKDCVARLADITRSLARKYKLPLIDVYRFSESLVEKDPTLLADGMHPSEKLYEHIGVYMAQEVSRIKLN